MARAYRKKPVTVEAVQWTGENHAEMCEFIDPEVFEIIPRVGLVIHTLEGDHRASPGDYIIKGVNGEFYPCKPDIFDKTYASATLTPPNEITASINRTMAVLAGFETDRRAGEEEEKNMENEKLALFFEIANKPGEKKKTNLVQKKKNPRHKMTGVLIAVADFVGLLIMIACIYMYAIMLV